MLMDSDIEMTYDNIAYKFDKTRYRVWNAVQKVLDSFEKDSNNIDMGCGNGKNMLYRKDINFTGIDISQKFIDICEKKNLNCYKSDVRETIFENDKFDNSISIAVIHHIYSIEERLKAINEMFRITKQNGTILIYVWAFEQLPNSKRHFTLQDTYVPFKINDETHLRYYHVYKENELINEINSCDYQFEVINKGYEMGNYFVHLKKL